MNLSQKNKKNEITSNLKSSITEACGNFHFKVQRKKIKPQVVLLIISLILGAISAAKTHYAIKKKEEQLGFLLQTTTVITAARDINVGELFQQSMFQEKNILISNMTPNFVTRKTLHLVDGYSVSIDLKKGDPILLTSVSGINETKHLSEKIPPGKRLFTLQVKDQGVTNGFIRPNDKIDILAHLEIKDRGLTTFTVLRDVTVISVGRADILSNAKTHTGTNISFFINVQDVEMMSFAQKMGEFAVSLRNAEDLYNHSVSRGIDLNEFLDYEGINKVSGGGELKVLENGKEVLEQK